MSSIRANDLAIGTIYSRPQTGESRPEINRVKSITSVKTGKHGSAKILVAAAGIFSGKPSQVRTSSPLAGEKSTAERRVMNES
jgi:translation elongation factor P/translation initiation factor 5A